MQTLVLWIVLIGVAVAYAARKGSKLFGSIIGQDPTRVSRPAGYAGYAGEPLALTIDTQGEHTYASDYVQNSGQTAQLSNGGSSAETPPGTSPTTTSNPRIKAKFKAVLAVQRFKQQGEKLRRYREEYYLAICHELPDQQRAAFIETCGRKLREIGCGSSDISDSTARFVMALDAAFNRYRDVDLTKKANFLETDHGRACAKEFLIENTPDVNRFVRSFMAKPNP